MESARGADPKMRRHYPVPPGETKHNYHARTFNFVAHRAPRRLPSAEELRADTFPFVVPAKGGRLSREQ